MGRPFGDMADDAGAQLDAPISDDSLAPRIYQLKYVSAVDIEDVLNELFLKKRQSFQQGNGEN